MWELVVEAGPDTGRRHCLTTGRHHLGRSRSCAVTVADAAVEPHHALVDVDRTGEVVITQISGRWPILLGGRPASSGIVTPETTVEVGDSLLVLRPFGSHDRSAIGPHAVCLGTAIEGLIPDVELDDRGRAPRQPSGAVIADLGASAPGVVVVRGVHSARAARSIVAQLARSGWGVIPMLADRREAELVAGLTRPAPEGPAVAVTDRVAALRSGPLAEPPQAPIALILTLPADRSLPAEATALLQVGPRWRGAWHPDVGAAGARTAARLHVAGCSAETARQQSVSPGSP